MKIEFITNASFNVELADGRTILTDPWYSDGIYHGIIFNYPPIPESLKARILSGRPDYIYVSHIHGDHFDPPTLAHFSKETPVLIGKFPTPALSNAIRSLGFSDVRELPFGELSNVDGIELCIFDQFSGSNDDLENETNLPIDTSIFIRDSDGTRLFHNVDNPIQLRHAEEIRRRFGPIDAAILPYASVSVFPAMFGQYTHDEKMRRVEALMTGRVAKFRELAVAMGARKSIPAAGSFVFGGKAAPLAVYQCQAVPARIGQLWAEAGLSPDALLQLAPGDRLDLSSGEVEQREPGALRYFSVEDRIAYARTLAESPCDLDLIRVPETMRISWRSLVGKARASMWARQQQLGISPAIDIVLVIEGTEGVPLPGKGPLELRMPLDRSDLAPAGEPVPTGRDWLRFRMSTNVALAVLLGISAWGVAEYHMIIDRDPDRFDPAVGTLLGYFKL